MNTTWIPEIDDDQPRIALAGREYLWNEQLTSPTLTTHWGHHGVVVGPDGQSFLSASPDGRQLVHLTHVEARSSAPLDVVECHGMSVDAFDDEYSVWIADNGHKYGSGEQGEQLVAGGPGQVIRVSAEGEILQRLSVSGIRESLRDWRPTGVTSESRAQGGRVWVADGYGTSYIHCFARDGKLLWSGNGEASGMRFASPHAILLDTRRVAPELLVADRGNKRIVAFTPDGDYLRTIGEGLLSSPSGFAIDGDRLWVTELNGAIVAFDAADQLVARWGDGVRPDEGGWPNAIAGDEVERSTLTPGVFRSPHGIAVNSRGAIAVSEWVLGGRLIQLTPA